MQRLGGKCSVFSPPLSMFLSGAAGGEKSGSVRLGVLSLCFLFDGGSMCPLPLSDLPGRVRGVKSVSVRLGAFSLWFSAGWEVWVVGICHVLSRSLSRRFFRKGSGESRFCDGGCVFVVYFCQVDRLVPTFSTLCS